MTGKPPASYFFKTGLLVLHGLLLVAFAFNVRAAASISVTGIACCAIAGAIVYKQALLPSWQQRFLFGACFLFFALQVVPALSSISSVKTTDFILLKTSIVIAPLAVTASSFFSKREYRFLGNALLVVTTSSLLYCLIRQALVYGRTGDPAVFFYHSLVTPLRHHAVYLSFLVLVNLLYLLYADKEYKPFLRWSFFTFLSMMLLLLSSRLIIGVFVLSIVYFAFRQLRSRYMAGLTAAGLVMVAVVIMFVTDNPFSRRTKELWKDNFSVLNKGQFSKSDYLNGAQFRILQWKLTPLLLKEQEAWITGSGMLHSQAWLDTKYLQLGLYAGEDNRQGHGYLGYNTHNQFLESWLQSGNPGLLSFMVICFFLLRPALARGRVFSLLCSITALLLAFTESVFEVQYGSLVFLFIPLFIQRADQSCKN